MSSIRNILYRRIRPKKSKNSDFKSMVNSFLHSTKTLGSIKFFLNGDTVVWSTNGSRDSRKAGDEIDVMNTASDTSSVFNTFEDNYSETRTEIDQDFDYRSSATIKFRKCLQRLKDKVNQFWSVNPALVRPNINTFWDGEKFYIDIPLLYNWEELVQSKFISKGSIYVSVDKDDALNQSRLILEKSGMIEDSDIDLLMETYQQSFKFDPSSFKIPKLSIGKAFNKAISLNPIIKTETPK